MWRHPPQRRGLKFRLRATCRHDDVRVSQAPKTLRIQCRNTVLSQVNEDPWEWGEVIEMVKMADGAVRDRMTRNVTVTGNRHTNLLAQSGDRVATVKRWQVTPAEPWW